MKYESWWFLQKVKDSWRVVNHRDIIPSVPRLMGYIHVAQPIYLAAGDVENAMVGNQICKSMFLFLLNHNLIGGKHCCRKT